MGAFEIAPLTPQRSRRQSRKPRDTGTGALISVAGGADYWSRFETRRVLR